MSRLKQDILVLLNTEQSQALGACLHTTHLKPLGPSSSKQTKRRDLLKRVRITG